jgi:hypothetical protein
MSDPHYTGSDLARWLQEAGRRRAPATPQPPETATEAPAAAAAPKRPYILHTRELLLMAIAALAFVPWFFADVQVEILTLRSIIAFVFPHLPH